MRPDDLSAATAATAVSRASRPRVLFVGSEYAGHRTRFLNLRETVMRDGRLHPEFRSVSGWRPGGWLERLEMLPRGVRGRMRASAEAAALAKWPRPDVTWTSAAEVLTPYLWAQRGPFRRPLVLDLDATDEQLEEMAEAYFGRARKTGWRAWAAAKQEQWLWESTTVFTPWSNWAAEGLMRRGVEPERIRVLPPGVDLEWWRVAREVRVPEGPLRLLFVGGDFARKGGDLLLELARGPLRERFELDIVTREALEPEPNVRVHRAEPNSPELRELYARADLFVLPTRADCFGIAVVEAMASGLPVLMGDVGGARDIVVPGETGWLVRPAYDELLGALEQAWDSRQVLPVMGEAARRRAETHFDRRENDREIISLLESLALGRRQG